MINNYSSLKEYLSADMQSLGIKNNFLKNYILHHTWHFQIFLRLFEYVTNVGSNIVIRIIVKFIFDRKSKSLGFTIPINVFGKGLSIAHYGTIVVNKNSKVGANCRIHVCVNIGSSPGSIKSPVIGSGCYIGPGAKIYGDIFIGDNVSIGANAVVNGNYPDGSVISAANSKIMRSRFE